MTFPQQEHSPQAEDVVRSLHAAAAQGRLTMADAEQRIAMARGTSDPAELRHLVSDLDAGGALGMTPDHPLVVSAGWSGSSEKKEGAWTIPLYLKASAGLGSVKLDLTRARPISHLVALDVVPSAGSVVIVVESGWAVDINRLSKGIGSAKSTVPSEAGPGDTLIVVTGSVGLGSFKARHPNWWERRKLRKLREIMR